MAVVDGATVVIGPPSNAASVGIVRRDARRAAPSRARRARGARPAGRRRTGAGIHSRPAAPLRRQQRRHDGAHVGAGVVGEDRLVVHGERQSSTSDASASRDPRGPQTPYDEVVRVSSKGDYACRALLSLALHMDETGPTSVRDIAERTGLPQPYLEQILLALKGAGLVRSKRGVGGGYVLARPPVGDPLGEILSRRRRPDQPRRLRRAAPGRRLRPRGPVRAAGHLEVGRRADAAAARGFTLQSVADAARGVAPWPEARIEDGLATL